MDVAVLTLKVLGLSVEALGHGIWSGTSPDRPRSLYVPSTSIGLGWVNMELLIGGQWTAAQSGREEAVTSPYDGAVAGTTPVAGPADVDAALTAAVAGARVWRSTPGHERMRVLLQAATLADERAETVAQTISAEAGKTITEARGEA